LRNTVTALDLNRLFAEVYQDDFDLTTIVGVDRSGSIGDGQPFF
jgi:hypothetical protein